MHTVNGPQFKPKTDGKKNARIVIEWIDWFDMMQSIIFSNFFLSFDTSSPYPYSAMPYVQPLDEYLHLCGVCMWVLSTLKHVYHGQTNITGKKWTIPLLCCVCVCVSRSIKFASFTFDSSSFLCVLFCCAPIYSTWQCICEYSNAFVAALLYNQRTTVFYIYARFLYSSLSQWIFEYLHNGTEWTLSTVHPSYSLYMNENH